MVGLPPKTNMTMKNPRFEDVFLNGDFPMSCWFSGVYVTEFLGGYPFLFSTLVKEREGLEKKRVGVLKTRCFITGVMSSRCD